ncbi:hypothetical protein [Konateibacter massiliensis]|uniref:hypothetical protein n=1 Tax=Konateibacter massiliensis TaxID=2002841 RepID=UPI000C159E26|nr:hypothetical protein [Konateibacter massiliensis]
MSAIKNGGYSVNLKGKDYVLLFSLNALDELQDKFGGYDKINEIFNENNKDWVKDTKWLLTLLINEGLLYEDENATLLTEQQVGRLIHVGNMKEIQRAIYASFAAGTAGDSEAAETDSQEDDTEENTEGNITAVQES